MIQYGLPEKGEELLTHNVKAINEAAAALGVTTMIASCPGCATMFKDYPRKYGLSLDVEVLHTTELFHRLIEAGKLRFKEWAPPARTMTRVGWGGCRACTRRRGRA